MTVNIFEKNMYKWGEPKDHLAEKPRCPATARENIEKPRCPARENIVEDPGVLLLLKANTPGRD